GHCSRVFADEHRVLKAPFQGEELTFGVDAALRIQAAGGPKVLRYDRASGAVLMERCNPGTSLADGELDEESARSVFVGLASRMFALEPTAAMPLREYA